MTPRERLEAHSAEFPKGIIQVMPHIHVAVGFAASNSIMIEGDDGVIIVDTFESTEAAEIVRPLFRAICDKPVRAIIYTHSHRDHISGATVLAGDDNPMVIARPFGADVPAMRKIPAITRRRMTRQFGMALPKQQQINIGVGPADRPLKGLGAGHIPPTHQISEDYSEMVIAGVRLVFVIAPGEADDTMVVWLPDDKVLVGADNFYVSFPNIYAIRGVPFRDPGSWIESLNKMIALSAEFFIGGHMRPIIGADKIRDTLSTYRDGIQYVFNATLEGMNAGLTPNELVHTVQLPEELAALPHMQEFYGKVPFAVRAIFAGYFGWFDGNPTTLQPLAPRTEAERIAKLAGGAKELAMTLERAMNEGDYQWAMQLADYLIVLEYEVKQAQQLKIKALTVLAEREMNAPTRNYYLSVAHEMRSA